MMQIGLVGRFFPGNWRLPTREIAFAAGAGFTHLQFMSRNEPLTVEWLRQPLGDVAAALTAHKVGAVMEVMGRVGPDLVTDTGYTPQTLLEGNLPAIAALGCSHVHWHLVPLEPYAPDVIARMETALRPALTAAVELARENGFRFGFEHNAPAGQLFALPDASAAALDAVPGLNFVLDFNHAPPADIPAFQRLLPRVQMLHVSDAPLPETNYHWAPGRGRVDFAGYCRAVAAAGFDGPAILEIGGAPWSGGFGQDTDAALIDARRFLLDTCPGAR
jgi:sugar phosphate isomerase/epimerase